jgi:hypothetical protein
MYIVAAVAFIITIEAWTIDWHPCVIHQSAIGKQVNNVLYLPAEQRAARTTTIHSANVPLRRAVKYPRPAVGSN